MDCLMHQVLVAMLAATPVPDAHAVGKMADTKAYTAAAPAKADRLQVSAGKKGKGEKQVVLITVPRPAAVN